MEKLKSKKTLLKIFAILFILFLIAVLTVKIAPKPIESKRISDTNHKRSWHSSVLLKNGRVLIIGGHPNAEIYTPATEKFTDIGKTSFGSENSIVTLLKDGKVLILDDKISQIFDPNTNKFRNTKYSVNYPRGNKEYSTLLLNDGRVFITSGDMDKDIYNKKTGKTESIPFLIPFEVYDPKTEKFEIITPPANKVFSGITTLLPNNKLLMQSRPLDSFEYDSMVVYDLKTNTYKSTYNSIYRPKGNYSNYLITPNNLLIIGGNKGYGVFDINEGISEVKIYDIKNNLFQTAGKTIKRREFDKSLFLQDKTVFLIGKENMEFSTWKVILLIFWGILYNISKDLYDVLYNITSYFSSDYKNISAEIYNTKTHSSSYLTGLIKGDGYFSIVYLGLNKILFIGNKKAYIITVNTLKFREK